MSYCGGRLEFDDTLINHDPFPFKYVEAGYRHTYTVHASCAREWSGTILPRRHTPARSERFESSSPSSATTALCPYSPGNSLLIGNGAKQRPDIDPWRRSR